LEGAAGQNFYTGRRLVKPQYEATGAPKHEQYGADTPDLFVGGAKVLSKVGVETSPAALQNMVRAQFGLMGEAVTNPKTMQTAFSRRFTTAKSGGEQEKLFEMRKEVKEETGGEKMAAIRTIERTAEALKTAPPEKRAEILQSVMPTDDDEREHFIKQLDAMLQKDAARVSRQSFDQVVKHDQMADRIRLLLRTLQKTPGAARVGIVDEWKDKGIIPEQLAEEIKQRIAPQQ